MKDPQTTEPGQPAEDPTPKTQLYVKERADRARNEAIGILGFVAVILSIATALGAMAGARSYIDQKINEDHLKEFRLRAEIAASAAESAARSAAAAAAAAQANEAEIAKLRRQLESSDRLAEIERRLNEKFDKTTVLRIQNASSGLFLEIDDANKTIERPIPLIQRGLGKLIEGQKWNFIPVAP